MVTFPPGSPFLKAKPVDRLGDARAALDGKTVTPPAVKVPAPLGLTPIPPPAAAAAAPVKAATPTPPAAAVSSPTSPFPNSVPGAPAAPVSSPAAAAAAAGLSDKVATPIGVPAAPPATAPADHGAVSNIGAKATTLDKGFVQDFNNTLHPENDPRNQPPDTTGMSDEDAMAARLRWAQDQVGRNTTFQEEQQMEQKMQDTLFHQQRAQRSAAGRAGFGASGALVGMSNQAAVDAQSGLSRDITKLRKDDQQTKIDNFLREVGISDQHQAAVDAAAAQQAALDAAAPDTDRDGIKDYEDPTDDRAGVAGPNGWQTKDGEKLIGGFEDQQRFELPHEYDGQTVESIHGHASTADQYVGSTSEYDFYKDNSPAAVVKGTYGHVFAVKRSAAPKAVTGTPGAHADGTTDGKK